MATRTLTWADPDAIDVDALGPIAGLEEDVAAPTNREGYLALLRASLALRRPIFERARSAAREAASVGRLRRTHP